MAQNIIHLLFLINYLSFMYSYHSRTSAQIINVPEYLLTEGYIEFTAMDCHMKTMSITYFNLISSCLKVEMFCVNHLINCSLESTEEFVCMEFRFTLRDDGMRAAFQLLHMVLEVMFYIVHNICKTNACFFL